MENGTSSSEEPTVGAPRERVERALVDGQQQGRPSVLGGLHGGESLIVTQRADIAHEDDCVLGGTEGARVLGDVDTRAVGEIVESALSEMRLAISGVAR